MTTPRDDISGLSERLRIYANHTAPWYPRDLCLQAATQLDALQARVKELEAERKRYDAEVRSWKIGHDQKLATLRRQTTRLKQERDEAYERAAKAAETWEVNMEWVEMCRHMDPAGAARKCIAAAIRRLAVTEKEGE